MLRGPLASLELAPFRSNDVAHGACELALQLTEALPVARDHYLTGLCVRRSYQGSGAIMLRLAGREK